jgi:hypothetical protein
MGADWTTPPQNVVAMYTGLVYTLPSGRSVAKGFCVLRDASNAQHFSLVQGKKQGRRKFRDGPAESVFLLLG